MDSSVSVMIICYVSVIASWHLVLLGSVMGSLKAVFYDYASYFEFMSEILLIGR